MESAVFKLYANLKPAERATVKCEKSGLDALIKFQASVIEIKDMEAQGLLTILNEHTESQSGHRLIDAITFRREA